MSVPSVDVVPIQHKPARFAGRGGALDGLRFAAAFGILIYHYGGEAPVPLDQVHPVFLRGYLATDFFLMLSGYVMARAYGQGLLSGAIGPFEFLAQRLKRIWPGHLVVLAVMAALALIAGLAKVSPGHPEHFLWRDLPAQVLLIQAWGSFSNEGWNLPSWSLSALVVCYAFTPLVLRAARRVGSAYLTLAIGLVGLIASDIVCKHLLHRPLYDLPFQMGVLRATPLFILGVAIARFAEAAPLSPLAARATGLAAGLCLILLQAAGRFDFWSVMCIGLVLIAAGSQPVRRPLAILETAARLSFAIFITHVLTATVFFGAVHKLVPLHALPAAGQWLIWSAGLPVALAVAALFDRYVDQPIQHRLRLGWRIGLATRRRAVAS
jgi:peptidoglycan/LPS O-acetylase OafA/YrhL